MIRYRLAGETHRRAVATVVALIRAGLGRGAPALPAEPPWETAVEVASAGLVLPALAAGARALSGGPAGLGEAGRFLAAVEAANAARNRRLAERLDEAAAALAAASIPVVALKGAAFLLEDPAQAPWRFLGDLDLLVPAARIDDARRALAPLSYQSGDMPELGEELHHAPPLLHADGETVVELHTRLFPAAGNALLPPERLLEAAEPGAIASPARADRLVHLIAHAQIADRRYTRRSVSLRDALDVAALTAAGEIDLEAVAGRFAAHGYGPAAAGFLAATARLLGEPIAPPRITAEGERWAEAAIASLAEPARLRRRLAWQWLADHAGRLLSAEGRRRAWATLRDPPRRRRFVRMKLFGWRGIR